MGGRGGEDDRLPAVADVDAEKPKGRRIVSILSPRENNRYCDSQYRAPSLLYPDAPVHKLLFFFASLPTCSVMPPAANGSTPPRLPRRPDD